jgi:membrane-associated protease RseP (regulator of RpoE activity)
MPSREASADAPTVADLAPVFDVYEVREDADSLLYVGEPRVERDRLERYAWPKFREAGYEVRLQHGYEPDEGLPLSPGETVLVARPRRAGEEGIPLRNVVLFVLTVASTLVVGAAEWYRIPVTQEPLRILEAWPFVAAVIGILGIHELGHYAMSRHHDVDASLPYFIPFPTIIGTMGAVIRMRGRIPDRKALFDIGVAGPLAGLAATVVVAAIGLALDPLPVQQAQVQAADGVLVQFNEPLLLQAVAAVVDPGGAAEAVHPVYFGAWAGALITFLNLIPVGQLDGGHVLRAMIGEQQERIAAIVPATLFGLAGYLYFFDDGIFPGTIWIVWGFLTVGLAYAGAASPVRDDALDAKRRAVGVLAFVLWLACFTPVPIELIRV